MSITMILELISNSSSPKTSHILSYNGFGKASVFIELGATTVRVKFLVEAGEISWIGEASKGILEEIQQDIDRNLNLMFDPITNIVLGSKNELFIVSDKFEVPDFNVGEIADSIKFSTKEWKIIKKFGAIADKKVHFEVYGNVFYLSAIAPDGMIVTQTLILDHPLQDEESVEFSAPKEALFESDRSICVEIGQEKIIIKSSDIAAIWAIDVSEPPFYPGLVPEGTIEIAFPQKELKPLLEKGGKLKININKKGMVQLRDTNGQQIMIQINGSFDVPPRTSFQIMADAIESAIRLIGTAKLITLALPVGLQYIAVSAAAVRCLLPTVVSAVKALTTAEITNPKPVVLESESATILVYDSEVTMTVSTVEKLEIWESPEPASRQEAIGQLKSATKVAEKVLDHLVDTKVKAKKREIEEALVTQLQSVVDTEKTQSISPGDAIKQIASVADLVAEAINSIPVNDTNTEIALAIEQTLLTEARSMIDMEKTQSIFSKEDVKRLTNAIVKAIARIEAIHLNTQTWEIQVTFSK